MTEALAWVAGLADGDGTFRPYWSHKNGKGYLGIQFAISNRCLPALRRCQAILGGGRLYQDHRNPKYWELRFDGVHAQDAAAQLLPYLVIKQAQAWVMVMLPRRRSPMPGPRQRGLQKSPVLYRLAQAVAYKALKRLNEAGGKGWKL